MPISFGVIWSALVDSNGAFPALELALLRCNQHRRAGGEMRVACGCLLRHFLFTRGTGQMKLCLLS